MPKKNKSTTKEKEEPEEDMEIPEDVAETELEPEPEQHHVADDDDQIEKPKKRKGYKFTEARQKAFEKARLKRQENLAKKRKALQEQKEEDQYSSQIKEKRVRIRKKQVNQAQIMY